MSRLDQALEELDLEAWLEDHDEIKHGGGDEIRVKNCPKCGNDKFKLYVNIEKRAWICYRCDWGRHLGDVCQLMAAVSGRHVMDIRVELAKSVVPAPKGSEFESKLASMLNAKPIPVKPVTVTSVVLPGTASWGGITSGRVLEYARRRGLTDNEITRYELRCTTRLRAYQGPYLVFPVCYETTPVGWQGRHIADKEPRYVSSDDIADWLWPVEGSVMSGVVLCEGVFDALGIRRLGWNGLCTFGKKISTRQVDLLRTLGVRDVTLAWDANALADIERAALKLRATFEKVYVADLSRKSGVAVEPDPGDTVQNPALKDWLHACLNERIDMDSDEFYQWRLRRALG